MKQLGQGTFQAFLKTIGKMILRLIEPLVIKIPFLISEKIVKKRNLKLFTRKNAKSSLKERKKTVFCSALILNSRRHVTKSRKSKKEIIIFGFLFLRKFLLKEKSLKPLLIFKSVNEAKNSNNFLSSNHFHFLPKNHIFKKIIPD